MYTFFLLSGSFLSASGITLVIASRISKFDISFPVIRMIFSAFVILSLFNTSLSMALPDMAYPPSVHILFTLSFVGFISTTNSFLS